MEKTEKFFIFTWKEVLVIALLVITLVGFFFTLGLHYGKKISHPSFTTMEQEETEKLKDSPEKLPPHETIEAAAQHVKAVAADTVKETTQQELAQTGVKLENPKLLNLPADKTETTTDTKESVSGFFVQLGSYTEKKEALSKVKFFSKKGVTAEIQMAEVAGVTRYRVVISGFKTKGAAEMQGRELKQKHKIENFIVTKSE